MLTRWIVTGLAAFICAACGSESSQSSSTPGVERAAQEAHAGTGTGLISDPRQVAHGGVRTIEVHDELGLVVAHRERIVTDGQGRFSVRPIEALSPVAADWEFRQVNREGYLFRYRDFAIRNQAQFERNYTLRDLGEEATVAGRACRRYRVEKKQGAKKSFTLAVDASSGLVLELEERDAQGRITSSMVYETYLAQPELSTAVWFEGIHEETPLDEAGGADAVGSLRPRRLPKGYVPHETYRLSDGGAEWVKRTYTDGVDTVFFLHRTKDAPAGRVAAEVGLLPVEEAEDVLLYRMGAAAVAQAVLPEGVFIAVGKVADRELVDLIESALP